MIKSYLEKMAKDADNACFSRFFSMLEKDSRASFLDCGCGIGEVTIEVAKNIGTRDVLGIELWELRARKAEERGIKVLRADLNKKLPIADNRFDVIFANQIFEHLYDTDVFLAEIKRILKPNGYVLICTPNLAGWQEIFSLLLGWQPFSLTNVSRKVGKLNPISLRESKEIARFPHVRIFTFHSFLKLVRAHEFEIEEAAGCGYHPFMGFMARILEKLDPRHSNFIVAKLRKG